MTNTGREMLLAQFTAPDERLLFAKALDQAFLCEKTGSDTFTDFLDPVKAAAFQPALARPGIFIYSCGGHDAAERRMLAFSASAEPPAFPIDKLHITYDPLYSKKLGHRDFLGAVLGLQISRGKIGDILLGEGCAFLFMASSLSAFLTDNLTKVGNTNVSASISGNGEVFCTDAGTEKNLHAASMRLDTIISEAFNLSRSDADQLISTDKAFVNWVPASSRAKQIKPADVITVRGIGRILVKEFAGTTKKGKIIVKAVIYS